MSTERILLALTLLLGCVGCATTTLPFDPDGVGNVSLHVGQKSLSGSDWGASVADQRFAGVSVDWTQPAAVYGLEVAVLPSEGFRHDATGAATNSLAVNEYSAGFFFPIRTGWRDSMLRLGLGIAVLDFDYRRKVAGDAVDRFESKETGIYGHAGILIPLSESLQIGFDLRLGSTDDPDFGFGSGDYSQATLILSHRF